jgi:hypothetical protein
VRTTTLVPDDERWLLELKAATDLRRALVRSLLVVAATHAGGRRISPIMLRRFKDELPDTSRSGVRRSLMNGWVSRRRGFASRIRGHPDGLHSPSLRFLRGR